MSEEIQENSSQVKSKSLIHLVQSEQQKDGPEQNEGDKVHDTEKTEKLHQKKESFGDREEIETMNNQVHESHNDELVNMRSSPNDQTTVAKIDKQKVRYDHFDLNNQAKNGIR